MVMVASMRYFVLGGHRTIDPAGIVFTIVWIADDAAVVPSVGTDQAVGSTWGGPTRNRFAPVHVLLLDRPAAPPPPPASNEVTRLSTSSTPASMLLKWAADRAEVPFTHV